MGEHPYRLSSSTQHEDVKVEGLGFPKDGIATVLIDGQGVPWCSKDKCKSATPHPDPFVVGCKLQGMNIFYKDHNPLCYPVIANAMAPLRLRLLRAYDNGFHEGLEEQRCNDCDELSYHCDCSND